MDLRRLGKTGYRIAPVAFGGIINTNEAQADADRYVACGVERGVNYFDVAPTYGNAEERLGNALKPHRKNIFLACKTLRRDAAGSKEDLIQSLKLLQTDYLDVYQMHAIKRDADVDKAFASGGAMETLRRAKEEGVVRKLGITAHSEECALRCLELYDFDSVLYTMNWAHGMLRNDGAKLSAACAEKDVGLLCMKVLAYSRWRADETRPDPRLWYKPVELGSPLALAAMKYCLSRGAHALVPPGNFAAFSYMLDNVEEALANPLSQADVDLLSAEAEKIKGMEIELINN